MKSEGINANYITELVNTGRDSVMLEEKQTENDKPEL